MSPVQSYLRERWNYEENIENEIKRQEDVAQRCKTNDGRCAACSRNLPGMSPGVTQAAEAHVNNPFVGATAYINQDYAALVDTSIAITSDASLKAKMETVKSYPTAVWIDRIAAIYGGAENAGRKSVEEHLDAVLAQKQPGVPITASFVIYNLPGRDCHALASNGELPLTGGFTDV